VVVGTVTSYKELRTLTCLSSHPVLINHQAHSSVPFTEAYGDIIVIIIISMFEGLKNNTISKLALSRFLSQSL